MGAYYDIQASVPNIAEAANAIIRGLLRRGPATTPSPAKPKGHTPMDDFTPIKATATLMATFPQAY